MEQRKAPGVANAAAGTPLTNKEGKSFIGGAAPEFKRPGTDEFANDPRTGANNAKAEAEESPPEFEETCSGCSDPISGDWLFCPSCGMEMNSGNYAKALSLELTEDDLSEYLFKGCLTKEVPLTAGKTAVFKTLVGGESESIETKLYEEFKDKETTQMAYLNRAAVVNLSFGWLRFDDQVLGDSPESRAERLSNFGVHLIDMASKKWTLFNRAVGAMLENSDILKNS